MLASHGPEYYLSLFICMVVETGSEGNFKKCQGGGGAGVLVC
jgi:hypothetical protein